MTMSNSDEILLARYRQGDARAFREIVERYSTPLYNLAIRLLRDSMEAENVVQDSFLRVITSLARVRLDLPFKPYLYRIVVNRCYDLLRARREMIEVDSDGAQEIIEDAPEILDRIEQQELHMHLQKAIEKLPPHYRTVIMLRYVEDFSYEEIAQAVNLPLNTVRTHLRRAKERLKIILETSEQRAVAQTKQLNLRTAEGS